jgi:hypothetical protein
MSCFSTSILKWDAHVLRVYCTCTATTQSAARYRFIQRVRFRPLDTPRNYSRSRFLRQVIVNGWRMISSINDGRYKCLANWLISICEGLLWRSPVLRDRSGNSWSLSVCLRDSLHLQVYNEKVAKKRRGICPSTSVARFARSSTSNYYCSTLSFVICGVNILVQIGKIDKKD